ncbi:MAG: hypothetical protein ACQESK_02070 [Bacteroidota bacterium]
MKKLLPLFLFLLALSVEAQVKDLSFTFSPTAEYVWWDDQAGLEDNYIYGGQIGFGFGEYLELSGVFQTSNNIKTRFADFGIPNYSEELFTQQDINLTRWGGEIKANLYDGTLSPFLILGTGIQTLDVDGGDKHQQIYANFGLGLKLALSDRVNLTLAGRANAYNFNAGRDLLTDGDKTAFGVTDDNFSNQDLFNWSAMAGLQFYLGGRKPGELSELDKVYLKKHRSDFQGLRWVIEPSLSYVDFDSNSFFGDTWMAGGHFGVDFTDYVGIRAFYFHSLEGDDINTDLDRLQMYGLEFKAHLNDAKGVNPYLVLGGGYLNAQSGYEGVAASMGVESTEFASAGLGLDIPLGRNFLLTGGARAFATSGQEQGNLGGADVLHTNLMYTAGFKIKLGKRAERPEDFDKDEEDEELLERKSSSDKKKYDPIKDRENYERLKRLKDEYKKELNELNRKLKKAQDENDIDRAVEILERKKEVEKALDEIRRTERINGTYQKSEKEGEYLKMTPDEFENLIDRILKGIDEKYEDSKENQQRSANSESVETNKIDELQRRIIELEQQLQIKEEQEKAQPQKIEAKQPVDSEEKTEADKKAEDEMLKILEENRKKEEEFQESTNKRLEEMNQQMQDFQKSIESNKKSEEKKTSTEEKSVDSEKTESKSTKKEEESETEIEVNTETESSGVGYNFIQEEKDSWMWDKLKYKGSSVYTGFNAGSQTTFNLGVKGHYGIADSRFELMPEAFVGFADPSAFGVQLNGILPFTIDKQQNLKAYVGTGGGYLYLNDNHKMNYNFVVGTYLNWLNGRVYIDYSIRNMFSYNHFSIGYRLPF